MMSLVQGWQDSSLAVGRRSVRGGRGSMTRGEAGVLLHSVDESPRVGRSVLRGLVLAFMLVGVGCSGSGGQAGRDIPYHGIQVIDAETGRGVPLVQLRATNEIRHYTDSGGWVAFLEPGLMDREVYFRVSSHGYEHPADGFGMRGARVQTTPGGSSVIRIDRSNIAQRLYRITGQGIYRDSVLLGRETPLRRPVINGDVMGQDSVQNALYRGRLWWFWGDTIRPGYPLGNFRMSGAMGRLPEEGGPDPFDGVELEYFVDETGFSRPMAPLPGDGMFWLDGLMVLPDESGRERLVARYIRVRRLGEVLGKGLTIYDDDREAFAPLMDLDMEAPLYPAGHPVRVTSDEREWFCFPVPYAVMRVPAEWEAVLDLQRYEGFTCLKAGSRYTADSPELDRDEQGRLIWGWKPDTDRIDETRQEELIANGLIRDDEAWFAMRDVESDERVKMHSSSIYWNDYRGRWIMIGVAIGGGPSMVGEVYYSESDTPEGPWRDAVKIVSHDRYSFYNPKQHPYFDQEGGQIIYFEGTYTAMFSRQEDPTPRYDYNQVMYRLDLADPRISGAFPR
jgi:hypothetical protein